MRVLLAVLLLTLLAAAPLAAAQQEGALVLRIDPPTQPLHAGERVAVQGVAYLTVDASAYSSLSGIPVTYSIDHASAGLAGIVEPQTDVFPLPSTPMPGASFTVAKPITVVLLAESSIPAGHHPAAVVISGATSPTFAGKIISAKATVPVMLEGAPICSAGGVTAQAFDVQAAPALGGAGLALAALTTGALVLVALRRPRALLPLGALVAAALVAPLASAQQQGTMILSATPPTAPLPAGNVTDLVLTTTLTVDQTAQADPLGVPVVYTVTKAPEWLLVTLNPSTDLFTWPATPMPGAAFTMAKPLDATLMVPDLNFTGTRTGMVEITATTVPGPFGKTVVGKVTFPVGVIGTACRSAPTPIAAPQLQATRIPATKDPGVTVQSTSAQAPVAGYALVGGFAVAGAGVGLLLRRRQSK